MDKNGVVTSKRQDRVAVLSSGSGESASPYGALPLTTPAEPEAPQPTSEPSRTAEPQGAAGVRSRATAKPQCAPTLNPDEVSLLVRQMAAQEGLDGGLAEAMAKTESGLGRNLVSQKNAVGIMQLMAATGADYGVTDRCDPEQNVRAGVRYMRDLVKKYDGNVVMALGAYNAGPKRVSQNSGVPLYPETAKYVVSVLNHWRDFKLVPASASDGGQPRPAARPSGWIEGHVINVE